MRISIESGTDRGRKAMTAEERLTKLEEAMLVQAELMTRLERRVEDWTQNTQSWIRSAETRIAQLEAISTAVLERMDRFIQGREGNGQK
ncbi:MAG: hypothetical protein ACRD2B_10820 [Terriglobia bacterium]